MGAFMVVDKEGTIVVADFGNEWLRKIVGRQVTTLAGGSEQGTADGAGACVRNALLAGAGRARAPDRVGVRPVAHAAGGGRVAGTAGVDGPGGRGAGGYPATRAADSVAAAPHREAAAAAPGFC